MIRINNGKVLEVRVNSLPVLSIYMNGEKLWPEEVINEILSCFASGYWEDNYPWTDDLPWTD